MACFFIGAGALVCASKIYGALLAIIVLGINMFYRANPWIHNDPSDQKEAWNLFVKTMAVIGGTLFMMTRGKLRGEHQNIKIVSPFKSARFLGGGNQVVHHAKPQAAPSRTSSRR